MEDLRGKYEKNPRKEKKEKEKIREIDLFGSLSLPFSPSVISLPHLISFMISPLFLSLTLPHSLPHPLPHSLWSLSVCPLPLPLYIQTQVRWQGYRRTGGCNVRWVGEREIRWEREGERTTLGELEISLPLCSLFFFPFYTLTRAWIGRIGRVTPSFLMTRLICPSHAIFATSSVSCLVIGLDVVIP